MRAGAINFAREREKESIQTRCGWKDEEKRKEKKNDKKGETRATGRKVVKLGGGEVKPRVFISLLYIYIYIHVYTR